MHNKNQALAKPCSDCEGLYKGTRSNQEPHQYLVASSTGPAQKVLTYLCLLCGTALTRDGEGVATRWKI
jgi:hypothetical protein